MEKHMNGEIHGKGIGEYQINHTTQGLKSLQARYEILR
jgi:hypothetical protein